MNTYPVFPNWVFEGKLELDNQAKAMILQQVANMHKVKLHFGYITKIQQVTDHVYNLSQLSSRMFFDNVVSHFQLPSGLQNLESCENQLVCVDSGHNIPASVNRMRWYQCVVFVEGDKDSSNLYLDTLDSKLYATPDPDIQEYTHFIGYEPWKIVFFPAHIPWGFTPNNSKRKAMFFSHSYHMQPRTS
tara:strand:- start:700 stop:1263 length:564 start_codon:yes stop_codon:yes gene_type:complete